MFSIPIYRLNCSPEQILFNAIQFKFGATLTSEDVSFNDPIAKSRTRTCIQISARAESALTGLGELLYDRLDLNRFFFGIPLNFRNLHEPTELEIREAFETNWGIRLDSNEIDVTLYPHLPRHPQRVKIAAKENALCWVGEVEGWVLPPGFLGDLFGVHGISFNDRAVKRNAFLYSHEYITNNVSGNTNLSVELFDYLVLDKVLNTIDLDTCKLLRELQVITGDPWCLEQTPAYFNLKDAKVVYNGIYDPEEPEHRIVVLELSKYCQNLFGYFVLHYNTTTLTSAIPILDLEGF
jgi:hypothetical protein